jgi:hypothetical protein
MPTHDDRKPKDPDLRKSGVGREPKAGVPDDIPEDPLDDDQADSGPDRDHEQLGA